MSKTESLTYYQRNRDKIIERAKEWAKNNKERQREIAKKWYRRNREMVQENSREWYARNRELSSAKAKERYALESKLMKNKGKELIQKMKKTEIIKSLKSLNTKIQNAWDSATELAYGEKINNGVSLRMDLDLHKHLPKEKLITLLQDQKKLFYACKYILTNLKRTQNRFQLNNEDFIKFCISTQFKDRLEDRAYYLWDRNLEDERDEKWVMDHFKNTKSAVKTSEDEEAKIQAKLDEEAKIQAKLDEEKRLELQKKNKLINDIIQKRKDGIEVAVRTNKLFNKEADESIYAGILRRREYYLPFKMEALEIEYKRSEEFYNLKLFLEEKVNKYIEGTTLNQDEFHELCKAYPLAERLSKKFHIEWKKMQEQQQ